jgi:hypothetical protein
MEAWCQLPTNPLSLIVTPAAAAVVCNGGLKPGVVITNTAWRQCHIRRRTPPMVSPKAVVPCTVITPAALVLTVSTYLVLEPDTVCSQPQSMKQLARWYCPTDTFQLSTSALRQPTLPDTFARTVILISRARPQQPNNTPPMTIINSLVKPLHRAFH